MRRYQRLLIGGALAFALTCIYLLFRQPATLKPIERFQSERQKFRPSFDSSSTPNNTTNRSHNIVNNGSDVVPKGKSLKEFRATKEWQEVPKGYAVPPGLEIKIDLETHKTYARLRDDANSSPEHSTDVATVPEKHGFYPETLKAHMSELKDLLARADSEKIVLSVMESISELVAKTDVGLAFADDKTSISLFFDLILKDSTKSPIRHAAARVLQSALQNSFASIREVFGNQKSDIIQRLVSSPYSSEAMTVLNVIVVGNCHGMSDFWENDWNMKDDKFNKSARLIADVIGTAHQFVKLSPYQDGEVSKSKEWIFEFTNPRVQATCSKLQKAFLDEVKKNASKDGEIDYFNVPIRFVRALSQLNTILKNRPPCWKVRCDGAESRLGVNSINQCVEELPVKRCEPLPQMRNFIDEAPKVVKFVDATEEDRNRFFNALNSFQ